MDVKPAAIEMAYDVYDNEDVGCPIILMHGWYWNRNMFSPIAQRLAKYTKRKVYNLDMRSHGESLDPEKKINKEIMLEDLKHFLDSKSIPKVSFVCHSMSCVFAHMLAIEQPHRVEKMVMIDYHPYRELDDVIINTNKSQILIEKRFLTKLNKEPWLSLAEARKEILHQPCEGRGQRIFVEKLANDLIKVDGKFDWKADADYLSERCNSIDLLRSPEGIYEGPILIIRGGDSEVVTDAKFERFLKFNPKLELATIDKTTHLLHFEKTDEFIKIVCEYLNSEK